MQHEDLVLIVGVDAGLEHRAYALQRVLQPVA